MADLIPPEKFYRHVPCEKISSGTQKISSGIDGGAPFPELIVLCLESPPVVIQRS